MSAKSCLSFISETKVMQYIVCTQKQRKELDGISVME